MEHLPTSERCDDLASDGSQSDAAHRQYKHTDKQRMQAAERKRRERERILMDPERYEARKALDRERSRKRRAEGRIKRINDMTKVEKEVQRKRWRENTNSHRLLKRVNQELFGHSRQEIEPVCGQERTSQHEPEHKLILDKETMPVIFINQQSNIKEDTCSRNVEMPKEEKFDIRLASSSASECKNEFILPDELKELPEELKELPQELKETHKIERDYELAIDDKKDTTSKEFILQQRILIEEDYKRNLVIAQEKEIELREIRIKNPIVGQLAASTKTEFKNEFMLPELMKSSELKKSFERNEEIANERLLSSSQCDASDSDSLNRTENILPTTECLDYLTREDINNELQFDTAQRLYKNTDEQRLQATQRKRRERERVLMDPERYEARKERERERSRKRRAKGRIKLISDMSEREKEIQRRKWRENTNSYRLLKKVEQELFGQNSNPPESSSQDQQEELIVELSFEVGEGEQKKDKEKER